MPTITIIQRQNLRARAHSLKPTIMIGSSGLTGSVLAEISRTLQSHELIKIRVMNEDRERRIAILEQICTQLNANAIQHIGKILVIYQAQVQEDKPQKLTEQKYLPPGREIHKPSPIRKKSTPSRIPQPKQKKLI
ncbi:YhbY family RNA-binding protein [Candidatus Nitrotoga fabula]|uniref:YhbY family RNA-binding protein n=1 Tax=Candidatus Nitrotoga fabula TaxID=2182327 RepID=UPI001BB47B04|nr:YhbY family RNA-binding protein [Candidatus Nitrotoga fabula]